MIRQDNKRGDGSKSQCLTFQSCQQIQRNGAGGTSPKNVVGGISKYER